MYKVSTSKSVSAIVAVALFIGLFFQPVKLSAQCGTTINTFPYTENFETGMGGWASGGTLNDWAWGTPSKPVISGAGSGLKCWVVGGLTTSFYNYSEASYVTSPCFDFTNLQHPFIAFLIFWESEHRYDGMNLQYSANGGSTWTNVGAYNDPVDCMNANWYNTSSVTYLSGLATPKNGWTGNIQATAGSCQGGSGSGGWVQAKHCLSALAGLPSVMLRFTFGAGTTCNNFDGIAFDSVSISEAPANTADFTFTCATGNTVNFSGTTALCPNVIGWVFGDPASSSNTATGLSASHTFSQPGTYNVTFNIAGVCNAAATVTKQVSIPGITTGATPAGCSGNTGTAFVTVTGSAAPFNFLWNNGDTSQNLSALSAGTYTVTISAAGNCTATGSAVVSVSGGGLTVTPGTTNSTCGSNNGTATVSVTSGTPPYHYMWSNGDTTASISGVGNGTYTVTVSGGGGCSTTASANVSATNGLAVSATPVNASCSSNNGTATVSITTGSGPYAFSWSNGDTTISASGLGVGTYTVTVTGNGNCTATASATISASTGLGLAMSAVNSNCGNNDGSASTRVTAGAGPYVYSWSNGGNTDTISNLVSGTYRVTVTGANNCTGTDSTIVHSSGGTSVAITSSANVICSNDSAYICAPLGFASYSWNQGQTTPCIYARQAGNYYVVVTDNNGCTAASNHFPLSVHPQPPVSVSVNGDTLHVYNSVSQQWLLNGTVLTGATNPVYIASSSGFYTVAVTDSNGCVTISNQVQLTVGIDNLQQDKVQVYPNPLSSGGWHVDVSNELLGSELTMFDDNGRIVYKTEIHNLHSEIPFNAARGVYLLRISSDKEIAVKKLIKL